MEKQSTINLYVTDDERSFVISTHLRLSIRNTLACQVQNGSLADSSSVGSFFNSANNFFVQHIIMSFFFHHRTSDYTSSCNSLKHLFSDSHTGTTSTIP